MTRIKEIRFQTSLGTQPGLGIQPHYEAPGDLWVDIDKTQSNHRVGEAVPFRVVETWLRCSQIVVKKIS